MEETVLREACFSLAEHLLWEKDGATIERLPQQIAELSEITDEFFRISTECYFLVEDLPGSEQVLCGAIHYLKSISIPPLRGNYEWVHYSLYNILELCNPQGSPGKESLAFLQALAKSSKQQLDCATEE